MGMPTMARDWEAAFAAWGQPPSDAEQQEYRRTEGEITAALMAHAPLKDKKLRVYAKGSYRRGTNVRRGSDVDIAVELLGDTSTGTHFITDRAFKAVGLSNEELGLRTVHGFNYTVKQLKQDVYDALEK